MKYINNFKVLSLLFFYFSFINLIIKAQNNNTQKFKSDTLFSKSDGVLIITIGEISGIKANELGLNVKEYQNVMIESVVGCDKKNTFSPIKDSIYNIPKNTCYIIFYRCINKGLKPPKDVYPKGYNLEDPYNSTETGVCSAGDSFAKTLKDAFETAVFMNIKTHFKSDAELPSILIKSIKPAPSSISTSGNLIKLIKENDYKINVETTQGNSYYIEINKNHIDKIISFENEKYRVKLKGQKIHVRKQKGEALTRKMIKNS